MNESVRLVNKGDTPFIGKYNNQEYPVPVKGECVVPWDAACLWLGDPRAADVGQNRARIGEYERLCVKFGVYEKADEFDSMRPQLEVFRFNGQRVAMLAEDPFGPPVDVFGSDDPAFNDPTVQISKLTDMVNELQAQINGKGDKVDDGFEISGDGDEPSIPEDDAGGVKIGPSTGVPSFSQLS